MGGFKYGATVADIGTRSHPQTTDLGGQGGVSGGANVFPRLFVALYQAVVDGAIEAWLDDFIATKLDDYAERSNDPALDMIADLYGIDVTALQPTAG